MGTTPVTGNRAAIAALKESNLVLDLMTLLFSPEQMEVLESGTKILLAVEPPEVLIRLLPAQEDKARVAEVAALMASAKEMHVTRREPTCACRWVSSRSSRNTVSWTSRGAGTTGPTASA